MKTEYEPRPLAIGVDRAGHLLGLGRTKIFELLAMGQLTKIKIGRRTLVTLESLDALIERSTVRPAAK